MAYHYNQQDVILAFEVHKCVLYPQKLILYQFHTPNTTSSVDHKSLLMISAIISCNLGWSINLVNLRNCKTRILANLYTVTYIRLDEIILSQQNIANINRDLL